MNQVVEDQAAHGEAACRTPILDRVLRAINHPLRRRILRELAERPGSASALAVAFGEDVSLVSYHLTQVLARECQVVQLIDTVARGGTLEKIYGFDPEIWDALRDSPELADGGWEFFPLILGLRDLAVTGELEYRPDHLASGS